MSLVKRGKNGSSFSTFQCFERNGDFSIMSVWQILTFSHKSTLARMKVNTSLDAFLMLFPRSC